MHPMLLWGQGQGAAEGGTYTGSMIGHRIRRLMSWVPALLVPAGHLIHELLRLTQKL